MDRYNIEMLKEIHVAKNEKDYEKALELITKYIKMYPRDKVIRVMYAEIIFYLGDIEKSYRVIKDIDVNDLYKAENLSKYYSVLLKINLARQDYKGAYDCYRSGQKISGNLNVKYNIFGFRILYFFTKSRAGLMKKDEIEKATSYTYQQILHYGKDRLLKELYTRQHDNEQKIKFNNDINLNQLLNQINDVKDLVKSTNTNLIYEKRLFKLDNCGYDDEGNTYDFIRVLSIYDNDSIVDMVPCNNSQNFEYCDLNTKKRERTKRLSQIDKFNAKYNRG